MGQDMKGIGEYLQFHGSALQLRSRRNDILASNIANAATPHFKARDLDFDSEIKRAAGLGQLNTTDKLHFASAEMASQQPIKYRRPMSASLDGNTVELHVEQMEFSENVMRYQTTLGFLNKRITGLLSAIKGE